MYLTDEQRIRIARRAGDAGVSQAEVIRRILDQALGIDEGRAERLAAVQAAFGICRDYPDWPEWLREVRGEGGADARLKKLGL